MKSTPADLTKTQLTLYLITEELKTRKFFNGLLDLGLDNCPYQPNLDKLIMAYVGLPDDVDNAFDFYYDVIEKHSKLITANKESAAQQALEVYVTLLAEVKRRVLEND
jgi:hypothetical protein